MKTGPVFACRRTNFAGAILRLPWQPDCPPPALALHFLKTRLVYRQTQVDVRLIGSFRRLIVKETMLVCAEFFNQSMISVKFYIGTGTLSNLYLRQVFILCQVFCSSNMVYFADGNIEHFAILCILIIKLLVGGFKLLGSRERFTDQKFASNRIQPQYDMAQARVQLGVNGSQNTCASMTRWLLCVLVRIFQARPI